MLVLTPNEMKSLIKILVMIFLSVDLMSIISCKEDESVEPVLTAPVLTTVSISGITQTSAVSGGNVTDDGGAAVTVRGVCWGTSPGPTTGGSKTTDGAGSGTFASTLTGLTVNTKYFVRAYATNSEGTNYGNEVSFTTNPVVLATLTTTTVSSRTTSSAVSGGTITDDGGGTISARGVCWSTEENPLTTDSKTIDGADMGIFASNLTGLTPNTTYYVRAYAINEAGVAYGPQISFVTLPSGTIVFNPNLTYGSVSDVDGNTYKTIQIGTQTWMAENLRTTKLNDNTPISLVTDNAVWQNLYDTRSPAYSWYDNDPSAYKTIYGALYNFYVVEKGNLCPTGWHVPSDAEGATLESFLGGEDVAGGKLKETGNTHWIYSFNTVGTNETGFTALPGGSRDINGPFGGIGAFGNWWSTTYESGGFVRIFSMSYGNNSTYGGTTIESAGLSVRCLKD